MYKALLEIRSFMNLIKGWPKDPTLKSAKVKVIILDKIVQLKTFCTNSRYLVGLRLIRNSKYL
jgi:hypothetical protein